MWDVGIYSEILRSMIPNFVQSQEEAERLIGKVNNIRKAH